MRSSVVPWRCVRADLAAPLTRASLWRGVLHPQPPSTRARSGYGAGWHTEPGLAIPEGLRLIDLPPYTPELQPAEHLWRLVDEPIVNRHLDRLTQIQQRIEQRCRDLEADPEILRADTLFRWWPQQPKPS